MGGGESEEDSKDGEERTHVGVADSVLVNGLKELQELELICTRKTLSWKERNERVTTGSILFYIAKPSSYVKRSQGATRERLMQGKSNNGELEYANVPTLPTLDLG